MKAKRHGGYAYAQVFAHLIRIDGVNYSGPTISSTEDWKYYYLTWTQNPATGKPWTQADLDSLQAGVGLRYYHGVGWGSYGYCDELFLRIKRGIICPP